MLNAGTVVNGKYFNILSKISLGVEYPVVARDMARFRICITPNHTK